MKLPVQIILFWFTILGRSPLETRAQIHRRVEDKALLQINEVTSSSFELAFYPTPTKLDNEATNNVKNAISEVLLMSSSRSLDFDSLETIEILVQGVKFRQDYESKTNPATSVGANPVSLIKASLLQFKIVIHFDLCDANASRLSQYTVDNLIVRTFSQPSTKSNFVDLISLTGDPFLSDVEDIGINLVADESNERVENDEEGQNLSRVDVILIIASSFILVGVFLVLLVHCKKDEYQDIQEQKASKNKNKNRLSDMVADDNQNATDHDDPNVIGEVENSLARMMSVEGNIVVAGSLESSVDSQSLIVISDGNASAELSFASSSASNFTSGSSSSESTCSSSRGGNTNTSSETSLAQKGDSTIDSESMGSENCHFEATVCTEVTSELASHLRVLSNTDSFVARKEFASAFASSASAPTILEESIRQLKNECKLDEKSIKSARSADSSESFELNEKWNVSRPISSKPIPKNPVLLNKLVVLESTREFHQSWLESKRKALEDIEEESAEDVFHVDVQRSGIFVGQTESMKSTWSGSVSEWMKSIRVVNSASETLSSVENSTVEPKSLNDKECDSMDLSLEGSLAASMVEP